MELSKDLKSHIESLLDAVDSEDYVYDGAQLFFRARKIEPDNLDVWIGTMPPSLFEDEIAIPLGIQRNEKRTPERLNREKFLAKTFDEIQTAVLTFMNK